MMNRSSVEKKKFTEVFDFLQQGYGEHVWFFQRTEKSQYPLRNMYKGQLHNGLRHGVGAFFYANGAVYEGEWRHNHKHGQVRLCDFFCI